MKKEKVAIKRLKDIKKRKSLVFLHSHNTIPETGWLINTNLFLTVLEAVSPSSRYGLIWQLVRVCWFIDADFSLRPHMAEGAREPSVVSFTRALIPFTGAPPS